MMKPPTESQLARLHDALEQRYGELSNEIEDLEEGAMRSPDGSLAERQADEGAVAATQEGDFDVLSAEDGVLRDVSRALQRLEDGSYGRCSECGRWIAYERLEALPQTDLCVDCAAAAEARAASE